MADPIQAWVDPVALREIGEELLAIPQPEPPQVINEEAAYGEVFQGYEKSSSDSAQKAAANLAAAKRLAEEGGLLAAPNLTPPQAPPEPYLGRMEDFSIWLLNEVKAESFFLLDQTGTTLWNETGDDQLLEIAKSAKKRSSGLFSHPSSSALWSHHVALSGSLQLEILQADTICGALILGLVTSATLPDTTKEMVAQGLQTAVQPTE